MHQKNIIWYWNIIHYSVYQFLKRQSFTNPTIHAGSFMVILIANLDWSIFNLCQFFFQISLSDWIYRSSANEILFLFIIGLPAFILNYFILFKDDKYLEYFEEFDGMTLGEKSKYTWVSVAIVLLILIGFFYSFKSIR